MSEAVAVLSQPRHNNGLQREAEPKEVEENPQSIGLTDQESPLAWKAGKKCNGP